MTRHSTLMYTPRAFTPARRPDMVVAVCLTRVLGVSPQQTTTTVTPAPSAATGAPRDAAKEKGTASIRGKVVAADSGKAMRRVQIALSSPDLSESRSISTNAQGTFEFKDLPAGRYSLFASRPGFLRLSYGQRRPGETGR